MRPVGNGPESTVAPGTAPQGAVIAYMPSGGMHAPPAHLGNSFGKNRPVPTGQEAKSPFGRLDKAISSCDVTSAGVLATPDSWGTHRFLISGNICVSKSAAALPAVLPMESGSLIADMPKPGASAPPPSSGTYPSGRKIQHVETRLHVLQES